MKMLQLAVNMRGMGGTISESSLSLDSLFEDSAPDMISFLPSDGEMIFDGGDFIFIVYYGESSGALLRLKEYYFQTLRDNADATEEDVKEHNRALKVEI